MFITKKHLSRRSVLKGMGVTVALPLLDAMVPAGTAWAKTPAGAAMERARLIAIEMVHGAAGCSQIGQKENLWSPAAAGSRFDLSPSSLLPLEPYRQYLTIVSGTADHAAEAWAAPEVGGDHFRSSTTFLTQAHPTQTEGSDVHAGTSLDQIYAQEVGQGSAIPSMQLCIEPVDQAGGCSYGYACVYTDTISWASPTEPLPMIRDPRAVFDQLFGVGGSASDRASRRQANASILDWVTARVATLKREVGATDRQRLDSYLSDVREIERRIQNIEAQNRSGEMRAIPDAPIGVPDSYTDHVHLMFDLMAVALQSDVTQILSFKMSRDVSGRVYPESGVTTGFHNASHHQEKEENIREYQKINTYHVGLLPYLLDKLKSIPDGDSNLLEKTAILYGSPMGDSNLHNHKRLPLILLGHANGKLKGNYHVRAAEETPMANVELALLQKLGIEKEQFGDSTSAMELNPVVTTNSAE